MTITNIYLCPGDANPKNVRLCNPTTPKVGAYVWYHRPYVVLGGR
jgi:hypothetical protein